MNISHYCSYPPQLYLHQPAEFKKIESKFFQPAEPHLDSLPYISPLMERTKNDMIRSKKACQNVVQFNNRVEEINIPRKEQNKTERKRLEKLARKTAPQ